MADLGDLFRAELGASAAYVAAAQDLLRAGYPRLAAKALADAKEEIDHAHRVSVQVASMLPDAEGDPVAVLKTIEQAEADVLGAYMEAEKSADSVTRNFAQSIITEQVAALGDARNDRIRAQANAMVMEMGA